VASIIQTAKAKDIHKLNVPVGANDKIITLSTCTRVLGAGDNQRFVVMARLLRADEDISKAISVTANPNPVLPVL
ncbi:MAG: hypothetical protein RR197_04595, partial [Oscillospiraceae bacterium]